MKLARALLNNVRELILSARTTVVHGVNLVQVHTNFEIGRQIVEQEQKGKDRAAYGEAVLMELADRLTVEFGRGFSTSNLAYMRSFFLLYQDRSPIFQFAIGKSAKVPQRAQAIRQSHDNKPIDAQFGSSGRSQSPQFTLGWTHYIFLLGVKNPDERRFYEIEATAQNWKVSELKRQYNSSLYERLALSRDKAGIRKLATEGQTVARPEDLLKEPLVLEFLGLEPQHRYSESDLETAIINQIERFLLELGKGFLFESRQRRFAFDGDDYFVDLVFYNRLLRCYVLIDLKIGKLTHQDLGQMQMYVNYFDRHEITPEELPTIGILLCKQNSKAMVKMTLPKDANIHAREYQLYLPGKAELQRKLLEWAKQSEASEN